MNPLRTRILFLAAAPFAVMALPGAEAGAQPAPAAAPAASAPASAAPAIDDAGAKAILDGVHAMLADMLGTLAPAADLLHATVQGDHYHIEIPIAHRWEGGGIGGDSIGADLVPLGDGRWRIANGAMPGRIEVSVDHPSPGVPGAMAMTFKEHSFAGVIDTTLATETKLAFHIADETLAGVGGQTSTGSHMDSADGTLTVTPDKDGTATLLSTSTMRGLKATSAMGKGVAVNQIASGTGTLRFTHLSFPALRAAVRALSNVIVLAQAQAAPPAPGTAPNPSPDPKMREDLHTLIAALAMSATSFSMEQTQDGLSFAGGPVQGTVGHMAFGMDLGAQDGNVSLAMRLEVDKPSLPTIPPGIMTEFLPSRVVLKPRLSGVDAAALRRSLDAAVDNPQPNGFIGLAMAVLNAHPPALSIDEMAIDTGPAHITGHGEITVRGPGEAQGTATVRATGLDEAMKEISADPQGKQALAGLVFIKGLGKPDGDAMVWDISYDGQKLLVNGNDLSAMAPPGAGTPAPPK
jgi:hypothetical protein